MRLILVLTLGATTATAQGRGLEYVGAPHIYSTLDRAGDGYAALARGVTPVNFYGDAPSSRDFQAAVAVTKQLAIVGRAYRSEMPWADRFFPRWYRHSAREVGVARVSWKGSGQSRKQDMLTLGTASSDMAIRSMDNEEPPSIRAEGRYWRLSYQYSRILRREYAEMGFGARVSGVHFTRLQRWERDQANLGGTLTDPYTVPMDTPGSGTGIVLEPGFMARVGLRYFKIGPDISLAYPMPGMKTAYDVQWIVLGLSGAINFQPRGMR